MYKNSGNVTVPKYKCCVTYVCLRFSLNLPRSEDLFYQKLLYDFENFSEIRFEEPLSIKELAILALNNEESGWCEQDGSIDELAENVEEALIQKADMLKEYYGISISSSGDLQSLPLILGKD